MNDLDFAELRMYVDRGRHAYRNRALGCYAAAVGVVAIAIAVEGADFYTSGPMVFVGFLLAVGAGFHLWYRSLGWNRNKVLVALRADPGGIDSARVLDAEGRAALLNERQVEIRAKGASIMLTVSTAELDSFGEALARCCPGIALSGFGGPT